MSKGTERFKERFFSEELPSINTYAPQQANKMEMKQMSEHVFERIYEVVKKIPKGKVATYGQVAAMAGNPRWARVVGYALHANPDPANIPCYRVVNRNGEVSKAFAFGGENAQIKLLQADGITVTDGRVDLTKYRW